MATQAGGDRRDFFISHSGADEQWAEWIATQLEHAGYTVELDVWEWGPGTNFIFAMENALRRADRVIAVYSSSYFSRPFSRAEHQAIASSSFRENAARVIPVLVSDCEIPELYRNIIRISLVGIEEEAVAVKRLISGVAGSARKSRAPVSYPGRDIARTARPDAYPGRLPSVWRVPPRNPFFVGRRSLLDEVRAVFQEPSSRAVAVTSLQGIGGVGKTQIAIEYAYEQASSYQIVWWADSDSQSLLAHSLLTLSEELGISAVTPERAIDSLWRELGQRDDWLLIYDNVDRVEKIQNWRPPGTGHWLLTSRNPAISRIANTIEVQEFERDESLGLLALRVPSLGDPDAEYIAEALGDLPLAIEQAAYFLSETGLAAGDYVRLLHEQPAAAGLAEATTDRHPGLVAAVIAAIERLEDADPAAAQLANLLSILAPEPLPIAPAVSKENPRNSFLASFGISVGDALMTAEIIRKLTATGLAKRIGRSIQMHRVTQLILANRLSDDAFAQLGKQAVNLLGRATPGDPKVPSDWSKFAILAPHLYSLTTTELPLADWGDYEDFAQLALSSVEYFYRSGRYKDGLDLAAQCYGSWRSSLGESHLIILRMKNNLGTCMTGLGQFEEAAKLYQELHEQYVAKIGPDAPRTLRAANNIGAAFIEQQKFTEAVGILRPTLDRMRAATNPKDVETLRTANNLAEALYRSGEYDAATRLAIENLKLRREILPPDHPDVLESMHTLGSALSKHDPKAAQELLSRTLEEQIRILGESHPKTRQTRASLENLISR